MDSPMAQTEQLSESELCPGHLLKKQEEAFQRDIDRMLARAEEFVAVDCPACGSSDASSAFSKFGFSYLECRTCRTLYMSPRPSVEVMSDYYQDSENYQMWADEIFPASEASRREKIHVPWVERIREICSDAKIPADVLMEVGPGFGTFSEVATQSGAFKRVVAVEPTPQLAEACRARGVEVIEKRIEDIDEFMDSVDVLASFETIEHLFWPEDFLRQCSRVIRSGGLLVLSCPNAEGFDVATLRSESLAVDPEHVNLFNPSSITFLLERFGFTDVNVTTPGRLDAEFVRTAVLEGRYSLEGHPFLQRVLIDEWDRLGWPFQQFLADSGLSSHMWLWATKA